MPPIQQQQTSRAGLITSLVVAIMFALGFLVWAVMNNSEIKKLEDANKNIAQRYKEFVDDSVLAGNPDVDYLKTVKTGNTSLFETANRQRKAVVKLIKGSEGTEEEAKTAVKEANDAVASNAVLEKGAIPTDSLIATVKALNAKTQSDAQAVAQAKADLAAASKSLQDAMAAHQAELAKRDAAVTESQAMAAKAGTDAAAAIAEKQKQVDDFSAKVAAAEKAQGDAAQEFQVQIQTLQRNLEKTAKLLEVSNSKLALYRNDVKNPIATAVDAVITQISPDSICYINLGFGDHVVPGLTFEVYDKHDGVPKISGRTETELPKGKASIEIINVGQNSSQCRILTPTRGTPLEQGDLCANIVYDKNIKPVFYVYGKFDMDQNGVATEAEAEVIRNLITRWGGKTTDKLNIETDFVVMGKEPALPNYTPDELNSNPILKQKMEEAQAALKAYDDVRGNAGNLHIPLMNQNRFLYYVGYFDQSKK